MLTKRIVLLALSAAILLLWNPRPSLSDDEDRVAGTYFGVETSEDPPLFQFLITFNREGTAQMSLSVDFLGGSPWYGIWDETGPRTISGAMFSFPDSEEFGMTRVEFTNTFNEDFSSFEGEISQVLFPCEDGDCVDPLDPNSEFDGPFETTISGRRIGPADDDDDD